MPCYLHVELPEGGRALLKRLSIQPYKVIEHGQPKRAHPDEVYESDLLSFDVSEADFEDLPQQLEDAVAFLQANEDDVRVLAGAGEAVLDFGHAPRRWSEPAAACIQIDRLPQELVRLAAALNVQIELSLYLGWGEEGEKDEISQRAA